MRTDHPPLYDNTLTGVLARLTHGILLDANQRAQLGRAKRANASDSSFADSLGNSFANSLANSFANSFAKTRSWLSRVDTWFWKQEMKRREAFLAQSTDIFDLERRMRMLERSGN